MGQMQFSFDGSPVTLRTDSRYVVAIDPLALDGLANQFADLITASETEQLGRLKAFGHFGLRIGVQDVGGSGTFRFSNQSFESSHAEDDPAVFDVDSGSVVLVDLPALGAVARSLTWDRFNQLLQSDDDSIVDAVNREVGGEPRFVILFGNADTPFEGDGSYRLRPDGLSQIE